MKQFDDKQARKAVDDLFERLVLGDRPQDFEGYKGRTIQLLLDEYAAGQRSVATKNAAEMAQDYLNTSAEFGKCGSPAPSRLCEAARDIIALAAKAGKEGG